MAKKGGAYQSSKNKDVRGVSIPMPQTYGNQGGASAIQPTEFDQGGIRAGSTNPNENKEGGR